MLYFLSSIHTVLKKLGVIVRNRKKKIIIYLVIVAILLILELVLFLFDKKENDDTSSFKSLTKTILQNELNSNALNLHYSFFSPDNYDLCEPSAVLTPFSTDSFETSRTQLDSYISTLSKINADHLNACDQKTYTLLQNYLKTQLRFLDYPYFNEPLSPSGGVHNELPLLLSEYTLYDKEDIQCYLSLLEEIPAYLNGYALFEQKKSEAGRFMSDTSADKVIAQCEEMFDAKTLWNNKHFLQTTFQDRLDKLLNGKIITKEEYDLYLSTNSQLLINRLMPAYHALADAIYLLKGTGKNSEGLALKEKGKEYYTLLIQSAIGTSRSPEEIMEMLTKQLNIEYNQFNNCLKQLSSYGNEAYKLLTTDPEFIINSSEEMLSDLSDRIKYDFPPIPEKISYTVKEVTEALSAQSAPAFYITPPADRLFDNVIYINKPEQTDKLTLYTTLAHEGFPGHLYQTVYHGNCDIQNNEDPIHCLLYYGGYVEGWAIYVENYAYNYAASLMKNSDDSKLNELICTLYSHNRTLQLCILSLLDLSIHYYGIDETKAASILAPLGVTTKEEVQSIYEYIVEEPGNYLKYYFGYLEILSLRDFAKNLWCNSYSNLRFHTFLLNYGPADFDSIRKSLTSTTSFV